MTQRVFAIAMILVLGGLVSSCEVNPQEARSRLHNALNALLGRGPNPAPSPMTEAQRKLLDTSKLLHEMFQVVLLRDPYNAEEFNSYVNTLSQGGSLEGIYNGFVNSDQYKKLEKGAAPADATTLQVFASVTSSLQKELSRTSVSPTDLGVTFPFTPDLYRAIFSHASLYQLKRVMGNEALKLVEAKRSDKKNREALASWYSLWVSEMAGWKVDFGISLRNKADPSFHRQWVMLIPADEVSDRVLWEVLNRVHRVLNETEANAMKKKGAT